LIPWWLWAGKNGLGLVIAALGSLAFVTMAVAVDRVGSERRARQALADQADQTELERARLAVLEQRTRFARELHDVVAHHMSLMAIRAESAPHRLGALPDPVRAEFGSLSGSARQALADMRRLLTALRSDQPAAHIPQPGLEDLPGLIGAARQAGMSVGLSAPPALDKVPPSAGLCAYRIIQEALSNAARHAAGAPVVVSVGHDAGTVTLQVTNGPGGSGRAAGQRSRARPGRDAGTGRAAGRLAVGRAGARWRVRRVGRAPARRTGVTSNGTAIRCLIVDDQAMVREGFAAMLGAEPGIMIAGQAIDGADAVRQARRLNPDVVLMDVRMPVMDGLAAARQILTVTNGPHTPRVLMPDHLRPRRVRVRGAAGRRQRVRAQGRHHRRAHPRGEGRGRGRRAAGPVGDPAADHRVTRKPPAVPAAPAALDVLTSQETEVLTLIAQGMSNTQISDTLCIAGETTRTHTKRILAKLGLRDRAQAVVIAYETGLVTPGG
jgi:DNA-binding NarL/FixJ family response regulator